MANARPLIAFCMVGLLTGAGCIFSIDEEKIRSNAVPADDAGQEPSAPLDAAADDDAAADAGADTGPPPFTCVGTNEIESNDTAGTAMAIPFSGTLCGEIASASDVDIFILNASQLTIKAPRVEADDPDVAFTVNGSSARRGVVIQGPRVQHTIEVRGARQRRYELAITQN